MEAVQIIQTKKAEAMWQIAGKICIIPGRDFIATSVLLKEY